MRPTTNRYRHGALALVAAASLAAVGGERARAAGTQPPSDAPALRMAVTGGWESRVDPVIAALAADGAVTAEIDFDWQDAHIVPDVEQQIVDAVASGELDLGFVGTRAFAELGTPALGALTVAQSPAAEPQPSCRSGESGPVGGPSHSGDGVADPAGRIAYAVVGRFDDAFGPIGTQLYAVDPDGSDRVLLLDCDVIRPQWSPDGSRLAFTVGLDDGSWQVATIAADGSDLRLLTSGAGVHEIPSWSPDGDWLAYDSADVGLDDPAFRATLWRVDADGSGAALLGDAETFDVEPRLSPDGSRVAFMRVHPEADWASEIVVRDLASGEERVVVPREVPAEHPEWSPDGGSLVFNGSDFAPNAATIYRIDLDQPDAEPVVLLDRATGEWGGVKPVYSPDGSHIVFVCVEAAEPEDGICIMDADGTNVIPLVDDPGVSENHVAWGVAAP